MARIGSIGMGSSSSTDRNGNFTQPSILDGVGSSGQDADYGKSREQIISRITSSYLYRQLYELFSQESDKYWLNQLQGILDSVVGANSTFWDEIGLSSQSGDRIEAIYQEAVNNMQSLYNEYRSYKNSLPINQVQQYSVAGINSAITGQGITSSEMPSRNITSGASSMPSTNSGEFALNVVSGLTAVLSSFAEVALKFKDLKMRDRHFQADLDLRKSQLGFDKTKSFNEFKRIMSDAGVLLDSTSWDDLDSVDEHWNINAPSRAKALHNAYTEYTQGKALSPTMSYAFSDPDSPYTDKALKFVPGVHEEGEALYGIGSNDVDYGYSFNLAYRDLGKMQVELSMNEAMRKAEVGNAVLTEGLTPEEIAKEEASLRKANAMYDARKAVIYLERLESLVTRSKNNDPIASIELINLMQDADWQESAAYMLGELSKEQWQILGTIFDTKNKFEAEKFHQLIDFFRKKFQ